MAREVKFELGDLTFTWDPEKYRENVLKHGITFEEAATTWLDPQAIEAFDDRPTGGEDRWFRIGFSLRGALLVTWSTVRTRVGVEMIRIIGARRATRQEQKIYAKKEA